MKPSIRNAARLMGKAPNTIHRWKTTNPHLYRAVMEYTGRQGSEKEAEL